MGYRAIGEFQFADYIFARNQSIVIRGSDNALQNKRRLDCADRLSDPLWRRCSWWAVSFSVYRKSFCGQPGLRVVTPSNPYDAKGMIKATIRSDDPVIFTNISVYIVY